MLAVDEFFRVPLVDMKAAGLLREPGILIPSGDLGAVKIGITSQFLTDAKKYHERYLSTDYFRWLLETAIRKGGFSSAAPRILDIGSGSGNSVFPCLEIFPQARIVATDLSPDLLLIMKMLADQNEDWRHRLGYVCMDSCNDYFQHGVFDIVVGAAILHHLIHPVQAILAASRALRPGGVAIFFEPFENGHAMLRLAYTEILRTAGAPGLPGKVSGFLSGLLREYAIRTGSDKSDPVYEKIDDKWFFTKSYFEKAARDAGFRETMIYPVHDTERPFSNQTEVNLKLGIGASPDALPRWAWDILKRYDDIFSPELKQDLLLEGCVILKR